MIVAITIISIASFLDGAVECFEFDGRKYFEKKFNVNPIGFWGSKSWTKKDTNPNIYNKLFGVFDFYHVCDDLRKYGYIGGAVLIGIYFSWLYFGVAILLSIVSKRIGMYLIRRKPTKS